MAVPASGIPGYSLGGRSYPSFSDPTVLSGGASRSSSIRSAHTAHNAPGALYSEGTTSTSYKSLANQTPRNGSLSYDSLLTPSEGQEFESAAPDLPPHGHAGPVPPALLGYSSPFLSAQLAHQREPSSPHRAFLPRPSSPARLPEREHLLQDSHRPAQHHPRPARFSRPPLLADAHTLLLPSALPGFARDGHAHCAARCPRLRRWGSRCPTPAQGQRRRCSIAWCARRRPGAGLGAGSRPQRTRFR
ncbi:hypothetical protein SKAU_G00001980 [Synaphobranchus kaupii]|uniref:Uncharacterized protein n=1 Tax=Synaphobranchus kaupii TaxID=118154 RepID=A0A9Q1G9A7_SYNKA|nr:hypothetical protein SKAU_G00001980 [Synaphobranchus kaupii]